MNPSYRWSATVTILTVLTVAALAGATPGAAATSSAWASGWSSDTAVQWTPMPPSSNVLGPPEGFGSSLCVGASSQPGQAQAYFTFPAFSIPAAHVIQGVEVQFKYETEDTHRVKLTDGGAAVGAERSLPINSGPSTCDGTSLNKAGTPTDTWGVALTPAKFNAGSIGVWFKQRLTTVGGGDPGSIPVDIDAVQLIVYHGPANTAPTADAGGPYTVGEGGSVGLSAAGSSDPDQSTASLTFAWDLDNDGMFDDATGISPTFSAAGKDGPSSQTVRVRVTDAGALSATDTATVTITNVAPTITSVTASPATIDEGQSVSVSGTFSDPALGVPSETFSGTALWSDGASTLLTVGSGTFSTSRTFADDDPTGTPSDTFTVVITISDDDGGSDSETSPTVTVNNVEPTVQPPVVAPEPSDEGSAVTATATYSDPGTPDTHDCTVDYGEGDGPQNGTASAGTCTGPSHTYGDNGSYTVIACVTDDDTGEGCKSSTHVVENVPPTVATPTFIPDPSDEGGTVSVSATFTDPGENDGPFTCTIDYGTGGGAETATVDGDSCIGSRAYGDNGTFTVEVCVKDKDDGEGCASADLVVNNLDPEVDLDTSTAITFPSGELAFLGRRGVGQSHDADGEDPGSDDLTFEWDFGFLGSDVSNTYFNDGTGPDPFPSPDGNFPFLASDTASVNYTDGGIYTITVTVIDDDLASASEELPKLVTGDGVCVYSQGFWRHQFAGRGRQHFDTLELQVFLDLVNFASGVFSEQTAASIPSEAQAVFAPGGSRLDRATAQALAAWLNWASGGVGWTESIDTDGDTVADTPFSLLIAMVEAILLDPGATPAELELAKDLAEAVNLRDADNPECGEFPRRLDGPLAVTRQD